MSCYFPILFVVSFAVAVVNGDAIQHEAHLNIKNIAPYDTYEGNFEYTIENFLVLPYYRENVGFSQNRGFSSPVFPASNNTDGVSWMFEIYPVRNVPITLKKVVRIDLWLNSLPPKVKSILASMQCGIVDSWGQEQFVQKTEETELTSNRFALRFGEFIEREILVSKAKELLPGGNLNLKCSVKGFLTYKDIPSDKIMFFEETIPTKVPSVFDCGREIAVDTIERLSQGDFNLKPDIVLESSGKQFKRHKAVLSARSPIFNEIFKKPDNFLDVVAVFNFTDEMNAVELEDMLTFLYQGTATRLDQSCRTLFVVAQKYQLDCLKITCEEVLMKNVTGGYALDLQSFAEQHRAFQLTESAAYFQNASFQMNEAH